MKIILSGHVDAILGVACLNVLEKAIDKVLLAAFRVSRCRCCQATAKPRRWTRIGCGK